MLLTQQKRRKNSKSNKLNLLHYDGEGHPTFVVVFQTQGAAVKADDLARDGKADAGAVGLCCKEWCEDILGNLGGDSRAAVGYLDLDALLRVNR